MTFARALLPLLVAAILGACSGPSDETFSEDGPSSPEVSGSPESGVDPDPKKGVGRGNSGGKKKRTDKGQEPGPSDREDLSSGGNSGSSEGDKATSDAATGSARVFDSTGDAEASGDSPPYTDMIEARIDGRGRTVRMSITFRGVVPAKMPDDDTFMSVETALHKDGRDYAIFADGNDEGWTAYISQKNDSRRLVNAFSIAGSTTRLEIPWGMIGGPGNLRWTAKSAWTRTTLTNTYFAFDSAPEGTRARYPN